MSRKQENQAIDAVIEDELLMLRHSGEIPEIAFHSSVYFLCKDPEGPGLEHIPDDALAKMKKAVFERYRVIVLRDMKPENRDLSIYRGLARSIMNYSRLEHFCSAEALDISDITREAAVYLKKFLVHEVDDVKSGRRGTCINCTYVELLDFASRLGIAAGELPADLEVICPEKSEYDV